MNSNKLDRKKQKELFFNIVIFLLIIFIAIRIPLDTDFWWHIRAGQLSLTNRSVVMEDLTSFSTGGANWINHSWLSQIIYFLIYQYTQNLGLMLFVATISVLCMWFVFIRLKGNQIIKGFVILLCVLTTAVVWSPRPQLFSLLLFSVVSYLVYEKGINSRKTILLMLLLFLIWGDLHAGFSMGILFLILYFSGLVLDKFFADEGSEETKKKDLVMSGMLALFSALVVMINPNGIGVWKVQFATISIPTLQNFIPEWASPNFHELYQQPFLWLWILLVLFLMINRTKYSFTEIIPLLVFGALGFIARRNYVYFAIIAIPILSKEIDYFIDMYVKKRFDKTNTRKFFTNLNKNPNPWISKGINLFLVMVMLLVIFGKVIYLSSPIVFDFYKNQFYPIEAVDYIKENHLENKRCLNSYAWGGYISWSLPEMKIFIDGRTDLYGEEIILDWLDMIHAENNWEEKMESYEINCVLLENEYPIVDKLISNSWRVVFQDEKSILILKQE